MQHKVVSERLWLRAPQQTTTRAGAVPLAPGAAGNPGSGGWTPKRLTGQPGNGRCPADAGLDPNEFAGKHHRTSNSRLEATKIFQRRPYGLRGWWAGKEREVTASAVSQNGHVRVNHQSSTAHVTSIPLTLSSLLPPMTPPWRISCSSKHL